MKSGLKELPLDGKGIWRQLFSFNPSDKGRGMAIYTIHDNQGHDLPIVHQYDTREKTKTFEPTPSGYFLVGDETAYQSWAEVAVAFNERHKGEG